MKKSKSLNRGNQNIDYPMDKKGFVDGFSLVAFLVVTSTIIGAIIIFLNPDKVISDFKYVGDPSSKVYYDISCLNKINIQSPILFVNSASAKNLSYTLKNCD